MVTPSSAREFLPSAADPKLVVEDVRTLVERLGPVHGQFGITEIDRRDRGLLRSDVGRPALTLDGVVADTGFVDGSDPEAVIDGVGQTLPSVTGRRGVELDRADVTVVSDVLEDVAR